MVNRILEYTVNNSPNPACWLGSDGKFVFVNSAACRLFGYSVEEFESLNGWQLTSDTPEMWLDNFQQLKTEGTKTYETLFFHKSGEQISVEVQSNFVFLNGVEFICNFIKDISLRASAIRELEKSEKKIREVLFNSLDAIMLTTPDGSIETANPAACRMFERTEEEIVADGRAGILDVLDPRLAIALEERARTGRFLGELTGLKKDGTKFPIEVATSIFYIGDHPHTSISIRDISERKAIENALAQNAERLASINATKDKFYSMISHDLRSPFHILLNFTQMLVEDSEKLTRKQIKDYSETLFKSISNLYSLLENLLHWSLVQREKVSFTPEILNLSSIVDQAFEIVSTIAGRKEISLVNAVMPETDIYADKNMLIIIIQNLASNGVKFSHRSGTVLVTAISRENDTIFNVSDSGIGMKEADIEQLFRQDITFQTPGTEREKGTGLGFALCREFVKRHSGTIDVVSSPGKGSRFIVSLPNKKPR